jgi:hypothetical protein
MPPQADPGTRARCEDCHAAAPHRDERLNAHGASVACQTCHVPRYAVETETKLWWDWSKAGRDGPPEEVAHALAREIAAGGDAARGVPAAVRAGFAAVGTDPDFHAHYDKKKGLFLLGRRQVPEYAWYDGTTTRHLPGERYDGPSPLALNRPGGRAGDPAAKIWPFKVHRGVQPFDGRDHHLLAPHTFGPGGYWSVFDWRKALEDGAKASGIPFSGEIDWMTTEMWWPQNHMVQRKEEALRCADCHGAGGRMDWAALGYRDDPARAGGREQVGLAPRAGAGAPR